MSIFHFYKSKHNFQIFGIKFLILNGVYVKYVPICKYKVILFINSRFEIGWWVVGARQIAMALYAIPVKAMRP